MTVIIDYDTVRPLVSRPEPVSDRWALPGLGASGSLARRLQRVYQERLARYVAAIPNAERARINWPGAARQSAYPSTEVLLDGLRMVLPIDGDLYPNLFDLYSQYGWPGIAAVQDSLREQFQRTGPDPLLLAAVSFFRFTCNLLAVLIRETLIELEAQAARIVFDRLGRAQQMLSKALLGDLAYTYQPGFRVLAVERTFWIPSSYKLRNRAVADSLLHDMTRAVGCRADVERVLSEAARRADGRPDPKAAAAIEPALTAYQAAQHQLLGNVPLAAVVLPGLRSGFDARDMETALIGSLVTLANGVDAVAAATRPDESRVRSILPGLPADWQDDRSQSKRLEPDVLERLYPALVDLDAVLITGAENRADDDAAISWLVEPSTWGYLRAGGAVEPGSFADTVLLHLVRALIARRREVAVSRAKRSKYLRVGAAVIGLLGLVFPPLQIAGVALTAVLIADAAAGAARQLAELDGAVRALLPALDDPGQAALAELGLIATQRSEVLHALAVSSLVLLATTGVQAIREIGEVLVLKAFYDDSSTLIRAVAED